MRIGAMGCGKEGWGKGVGEVGLGKWGGGSGVGERVESTKQVS